MEFVPILVLGATVKKLVDFVRFFRTGNYEAIAIQVLAWIGGAAVVALAAHTTWADGIVIGDTALRHMNLASQILAGIALGSAASLAHDVAPAPAATAAVAAVGAHRKE